MKKHKILMITDAPQLTSGYGTIGRHLATHWHEQGHEIQYMGWWARGDMEKMPFKVYNATDQRDKWGLKLFPKVIEEFRPDIVWTTGDLWMVYYISKFKGRNSFQSIWYSPIDSEGSPKIMRTPFETIDWIRTMEEFNHVVGQTKFCKDEIRKLCGHDLVKTVIYPGYEPDIFKPLGEITKKQLKKQLVGDENAFVVLFISRNGMRKNPCGAMEAFKLANIPNSKIYFHCNFHEARGYDLKEFVNRYDLNDKAVLSNLKVGHGITPEQVNLIYNAADVQILLSSREGFGITALESAACGVPMVFTNANSFKEYAYQFGEPVKVKAKYPEIITGQLMQIPDVQYAAKKLYKLYKNEKLRNQYSKSGIEFAKNHTWEKQYERWDEFLEQIDTSKNTAFVSPMILEKKKFPKYKVPEELKVGVMTTWNERCGIARYSRNSYQHVEPNPIILAADTMDPKEQSTLKAIPCWSKNPSELINTYEIIRKEGINVIHIQNEWALYWANKPRFRAFISAMHDMGIPIFITHHTCPTSTDSQNIQYFEEIIEWSKHSIPIVHNQFFADILEQWPSFRKKVMVIPHGCDSYKSDKERFSKFTIISSGFAHPSKGFELVVDCDKYLKFPHEIILQTSVHPGDKSGTQQKYLEHIRSMSKNTNVKLIENFLSDQEVSELCARSHIGLFMYAIMKCQGVSGAACTCLGAGTPIITSSSPAFYDVKNFPHGNFNSIALAEEITKLYENQQIYNKELDKVKEYQKTRSWKILGRKYSEIYKKAHEECVKKRASQS